MRRFLPLLLITRLAMGFLLLVVAIACSPGGGSGTPVPLPVTAPQALTYATNPAVYTRGVAIAPNAPSHAGGAVLAYGISPALPSGLVLDPLTGSLTGTSGSVTPAASYTVTASNSGNALAVWGQSDGTRRNIWSNRYMAGTGWGTAVLLETDNAGDANAPQIALGANGNALAVWYQSDGTRTNIWSNRFQ